MEFFSRYKGDSMENFPAINTVQVRQVRNVNSNDCAKRAFRAKPKWAMDKK